MYVLAVDTAGPVIGVALWAHGTVYQRTERVLRGSETRLAAWSQQVCADAGVTLQHMDAVAVARGPGGFTGLRVGLSTALGLAHGIGCPVVPIVSLVPRAHRARTERVLSLLDARKDRVYALWSTDRGVTPARPLADVAMSEALSWIDGPFTATGEGAIVYRAAIEAAGGTVADNADDPAVGILSALGAAALSRGEGVPPTAVSPLYLRRPDAKTTAERAAVRAAADAAKAVGSDMR